MGQDRGTLWVNSLIVCWKENMSISVSYSTSLCFCVNVCHSPHRFTLFLCINSVVLTEGRTTQNHNVLFISFLCNPATAGLVQPHRRLSHAQTEEANALHASLVDKSRLAPLLVSSLSEQKEKPDALALCILFYIYLYIFAFFPEMWKAYSCTERICPIFLTLFIYAALLLVWKSWSTKCWLSS